MYYVLFVFAMLTPVLMAVVGLIWRIHPPKRDGGFLAYRTALSSKTEETWAFAHRHISKLWLRIGLLLSILSAVLMVVFRECLLLCTVADRRTDGISVYLRISGGCPAEKHL